MARLSSSDSPSLDQSVVHPSELHSGRLSSQDSASNEEHTQQLSPEHEANGHGLNDDYLGKSPSQDEAKGFVPVLTNKNFLALWGGQVFSQLADKVYLVLMVAIIADQFQAADQTISGWVSAIMIAFTIPAILFGSLAGVFVNRWSKKLVLVTTNILRGGLVLLLPLLLWLAQGNYVLGNVPQGFCILLSVTFLVSTLTQFFAPAEQSAIPLIVDRQHLLSANSLYTTTMMGAVIIGFAVGEPLLDFAETLFQELDGGVGWGKPVLVGISYVVAGMVLLWVRAEEKIEREVSQPYIWQDIWDGVQYLSQQKKIRNALIQLVILFSVFAALAVLAVRLAEVIPVLEPSEFGILLAAGGIGMAIGAALLGQFGQSFAYTRLSLIGALGMSGALLCLSFFTQQLWVALLCIATLGIFAVMVGIPMQTIIQEETPEAMRGKVFGLQNNAINIALSLPLVLAGIAETYLGLQLVLVGLSLMVCVGGFVSWYVSQSVYSNNMNDA